MTNINSQNHDFLFMLEHAIKAPSGHNTQPWLFKINNSSIEIHPNLEKYLPAVDFDNRELFISLGCAAENLCIAASHKGYDTDVSIEPAGIITIRLKKNIAITPDVLLEQIAIRQTNRNVYNGNIIPVDIINILETPPFQSGIKIHLFKSGTFEFDSIAKYIYQGNIIQMQDKAFKDELFHWMRYNKKHQDETNDGLSYAVVGAPNLPKWIVKPIMAKALNGKIQNKSDKKKLGSASHIALFTISKNSIEEWVNLGRVFERFLLKSTELKLAHSYFNQPNELRELSIKMIESLNISKEYPAILIRLGYGEKMPYSKRKKIEEAII